MIFFIIQIGFTFHLLYVARVSESYWWILNIYDFGLKSVEEIEISSFNLELFFESVSDLKFNNHSPNLLFLVRH